MRRALVVLCALLMAACGRELLDQDSFVQPDLSGSVRVLLTASADDGSSYALRDLTLEIGGSALLTLSSEARVRDALVTPLPVGSYSLFVRPGFRMVRIDADGREHAVDARLATGNPLRFTIGEVEDATLKLTFAAGEQTVVFGAPPLVRVTRAP